MNNFFTKKIFTLHPFLLRCLWLIALLLSHLNSFLMTKWLCKVKYFKNQYQSSIAFSKYNSYILCIDVWNMNKRLFSIYLKSISFSISWSSFTFCRFPPVISSVLKNHTEYQYLNCIAVSISLQVKKKVLKPLSVFCSKTEIFF